MTKTSGVIYGALICAGVVLLWTGRHKEDHKGEKAIKATVLPATDQARVVVDPEHHTLTVVRRNAGNKTVITSTFLPHSGASVDLRRDGDVVVTAPKWGTEVGPFVGGAFGSDIRLRAVVGLNLLYIQRWELGGGLLVDSNIHDTRVFAHVSYNAYANYYLAAGVDNRRTVHLMAGLKF